MGKVGESTNTALNTLRSGQDIKMLIKLMSLGSLQVGHWDNSIALEFVPTISDAGREKAVCVIIS